jgi:4-amino-4-deoxy-L-arabinose transferase-like glycosyltransferase
MTRLIANEKKRFFNLKAFFTQKYTWASTLNDNSKNWFCLGVPLLVSLLVKIVLLLLLHDGAVNTDGTLYIRAAIQFAEGNFSNGLALYPMPVYSLLIALTHMVIPDWVVAGYSISIVSIVLATIPLYFLTRNVFGRRSAFWACLVFAVLPEMNEWALYISRDALFLLLFAWCVYFALRSIREAGFFSFWVTFFIAWGSIFVRIEGIAFIVFFSGVLVYLGFTNRKEKNSYFLRSLIWTGVPVCLAIIVFLSFGSSGIAVNRFDQVYFELTKFFNGGGLDLYFRIYQFFSEAEKYPPFSGLHYNFASLARHYLLVIYLMGIVEVFMKVIFPLSCIPLYIGLKNRIPSSGKFILCLCFVNLGVVYYSLLTRDFLTTRFLMIPAFLMIPWVGSGINKLCEKINKSSRKKLLLLLIMATVLAPALKSFEGVSLSDNATPLAVKWLAENNMLKNSYMATNDKKLSFYIELEKEEEKPAGIIHYFDDPKGTEQIELFALKNNAETLIINLRTKKIKKIPAYKHFKKIHTVLGAGDIVQIYSRNNIQGAQAPLL